MKTCLKLEMFRSLITKPGSYQWWLPFYLFITKAPKILALTICEKINITISIMSIASAVITKKQKTRKKQLYGTRLYSICHDDKCYRAVNIVNILSTTLQYIKLLLSHQLWTEAIVWKSTCNMQMYAHNMFYNNVQMQEKSNANQTPSFKY